MNEQVQSPTGNSNATEEGLAAASGSAPAPTPTGDLSADGPRPSRAAALIVTLTVAMIVGLSLWYLVQPQPLLVQGEANATRIDIAARVDGRVGERPAERGQNVAAGQVLVRIDNPQILSKLKQAQAERAVAVAELAHIDAGTREEVVAQRKAAIASAEANLVLAQQTYDRTNELTTKGVASTQTLNEVTASLDVARRGLEQAKLSYDESVAGYTKEERGIAEANVDKATAAVATLNTQVDEMTVKAPVGSQVYQIGAELGEFVSPGVPLLSLIDLSDVWLSFDLREDLVKGLKVGDKLDVRIPALGDRVVPVEIKTIATRGEYSGWRATRATGDFDLRTFEVRAYPTEKIAELRPGMSAYLQWSGGR
ncbi:HlyD family secretion protein [Rhizobium sp. RAF56]|uniref:HlyD family secretion protein n=1 Tax=Rhizobium sp. RAF56 TaxID=3233062 RepID=UPI003F9E12A8